LKLLQENIIDSRFKLLAADFQDQLDDLKGQVATLKGSKTISSVAMTPQHHHEIQSDPTKVYGMPTSCSDLQLLGYKLNGLYLVKSSKQNLGITKIETVFCDFQSKGETK